ncbi:hypothetical protein ACPWWF_001611 [Campylobacter coli]
MVNFLVKTLIISFVITFILFCFSFLNLKTYIGDIERLQNKIEDMNETQMIKEYNTTNKEEVFYKLLKKYIKKQENDK